MHMGSSFPLLGTSCFIMNNYLLKEQHVTEYSVVYNVGTFGSTVGWGTVLQVRRMRVRFLMVSLEFFFGHF